LSNLFHSISLNYMLPTMYSKKGSSLMEWPIFISTFPTILTMDPIVISFIKLLMWFPFYHNFLLTCILVRPILPMKTSNTIFIFKKIRHWKLDPSFFFLPGWTLVWFYHLVHLTVWRLDAKLGTSKKDAPFLAFVLPKGWGPGII
jgi:hypothetical protein